MKIFQNQSHAEEMLSALARQTPGCVKEISAPASVQYGPELCQGPSLGLRVHNQKRPVDTVKFNILPFIFFYYK